jgi:trimeric autotransporter adhesin
VIAGEQYTLYISNFSRSGLSFNLSWQFTNGADISCTILPVEWLSFEGQAVDRTAELEWITATETGSSHYIVERSTDGYTFEAIGELPAAGNSYSTLSYRFTDEQPERGVNYYRIKQVDLDGSSDLSDVVSVAFDRTMNLGKPYPNPTADRIALEITLEQADELTVTVLDASGRLVRTFSHRQEAGMALFTAPVGDLEPGAYHLLIAERSGATTQGGRFIVE